MSTTLLIGAVLALAALGYVLYPLFASPGETPERGGEPSAALSPEVDAAVEAALRKFRAARPACPACGPRPEGDAVFCSNCGRRLGPAEGGSP